jgi:hypothetical protein
MSEKRGNKDSTFRFRFGPESVTPVRPVRGTLTLELPKSQAGQVPHTLTRPRHKLTG